MQLRHAVVCLLVITGCCCSTNRNPGARAQAGQSGAITMLVQGGRGVALLPISNDSDNPLPLNLSSGAVIDATTGSEIAGAAVSFLTESGRQALENISAQGSATTPQNPAQTGNSVPGRAEAAGKPAQSVTVPAHSKSNVQVKVTNLTGTTWAKMSVFNQGADVGDVNLVSLDDPLNVSIEGLGSAAATPISSTYGNSLAVNLKNNSAEFLALDCLLEVNNSSISCGKVVLPPNASKAVPLCLDRCAFSWTDLVQPSTRVGELKLTAQVPAGIPADMVPVKVLPLHLTMQAAGPISVSILSLLYVGLFLAMGAFLSILASTVLPNLV